MAKAKPVVRWVKYYGWPYLMLRELGWAEVNFMVNFTILGIPEIWVKMEKPDEPENSRLHRRK